MIEYRDSFESTIINNLSALSDEQLVIRERRICELNELLSNIINKVLPEYGYDLDAYELLSIISESIPIHKGSVPENSLLINKQRLLSYSDSEASFDKVIYCELLLEILRNRSISIKEDDFLLQSKLNETFVYIKNGFSDEAFDVFSQSFKDPRVRYAESFKESISLLDASIADYCLLPFEEGGGKRLRTVEEIIFKNDLKINAITPVFGFDAADMKYALVSKTFARSLPKKDDDRYLEIRLSLDGNTDFSELFTVSKVFGLSIYRMDTVSFDTEDGNVPYVSIVFRNENRDFTSLLVYLTLFTQSFSLVGLYKNLE